MEIFETPQALAQFRETEPASIWASPPRIRQGYDDIRPGQGGARVFQDFVDLDIRPKFKFQNGARFFTAGSCFARNIERALHERGQPVLSWRPGLEIGNEWFHRYNTFSIINDFDNALKGQYDERLLMQVKTSKYVDYSAYGSASNAEELKAKREAVIKLHGNVVESDVLILTLGLVEAWFDTITQRYLNVTPFEMMLRTPERYQLHVTDYGQNLDALFEFREFIKKSVLRDIKIIVTVSPVPFNRTFSRQDVIIANTYSKSTLRAVAQAFADGFDDVDYFPSYEQVTLSNPEAAWLPDHRHVRADFVDKIMTCFLKHYLP